MRAVAMISAALALSVSAGCGNEIGDSCTVSSDCSPTGERMCDRSSPDGYCTVLGCDFDTCPEEAVCVRFFPSTQSDLPCETDADCTPDELCTLGGFCVPRTSEVRYCMKKCGGQDDCREEYECRDEQLMRDHGGEPLLAPDDSSSPPSFCAPGEL